MTDPSDQLAAVRRGLDVAAQQATAATEGPWSWNETRTELSGPHYAVAYDVTHDHGCACRRLCHMEVEVSDATAELIAAWNPVRVLAHVGSLRTICDGIEKTLAEHEQDDWYCLTCIVQDKGRRDISEAFPERIGYPCPTVLAAVSSLAGLAAVWAPTEGQP